MLGVFSPERPAPQTGAEANRSDGREGGGARGESETQEGQGCSGRSLPVYVIMNRIDFKACIL